MKTQFEFTRQLSSEAARNLTDNDLDILKVHHEYGLVSVKDLCVELGKTSYQYIRKRCTILCKGGYLVRPEIQEEIYKNRTGAGSRPLVHSLGQGGADALADRLGYETGPRNWNDKARNRGGKKGQFQFEHEVEATGVIIALKRAYSQIEGVEVLSPQEIITGAPQATRAIQKPWSMPTPYTWPKKHTVYHRNVVPDGVFAYRWTIEGQEHTFIVFIEYDRDTMQLTSEDGERTSIEQKVAAYVGLHKSALVKQRFGVPHFQVMFVTAGNQHHRSGMYKAARDYMAAYGKPVPKGLFYFTTTEEFYSAQSPLDKIWVDWKGGFRGFRTST